MSRNIKIRDAINQLEERGFRKTVDSVSEYSINADLYFRKIDTDRYVIFNHYNKTKKEDLQGFDCWISKYNSENEIGKKSALNTEDVRLTFDFSKDWKLLSDYL